MAAKPDGGQLFDVYKFISYNYSRSYIFMPMKGILRLGHK